ncbi:hypothetical protein [Terrarubrum flagellatum]|uniref:hypothetical protein n=1 Tax=Terrirubrum flagellatum TaxID=2895980 RepID=UPI0031454A65
MKKFRANGIHKLPWVNGRVIRFVLDNAGPRFVAADVCRAIGYRLNAAGAPNTTVALATIDSTEKELAELEVDPSLVHHPYVRFMLISPIALIQIVAMARENDPGPVAEDPAMRLWLSSVIAKHAEASA